MNNLPRHLAIIMDGNGRWAKQQGFWELLSESGTKSVKTIIESCAKIRVENDLYAFSTDKQPKLEVDEWKKNIIKQLKKRAYNITKQ
jgi:undecaprenyl diphosphate synthase